MARRALGVVALIVMGVALGAPLVGAQDDGPPAAFLRSVDSTNPEETLVTFLFSGDEGDATSAKVFANGDEVDRSDVVPLEQERGLVVVVDTATVLDDKNALTAIRTGLENMMGQLENEQVAVVAAAEEPELISTFTSDPDILTAQIADITAIAPDEEDNPSGTAAIWSSVSYAAELLEARGNLQPNVMLIVGSNDPNGSYSRAKGAISNANASVFSVNYTGAGYGGGPTTALTQEFGGQAVNVGEAGALEDVIPEVHATTTDQFQFTTSAPVDRGEVVDLRVEAGDTDMTGSYVQGTAVVGQPVLNPDVADSGPGISALQTPLGLVLAVVFVLVAGGLLAYGVITLFVPDESLSNVLEVYSEGFHADDDDENVSLAKSAVIQRAVELTEQVADSQGYLSRAEAALERANLPLRAGEAMFFYGAAVIAITLLALVLSRSLVFGIVIGLVGALIPGAVVSFLANRRKKKFVSQLPDTLQLLAGTLRAGYSLMQGVEAVSQEIDGPMGAELRRVVTEARLGRPLEESLDGTADRMNSEDFGWCVMAIKIQREVGGNLAELLLTVADTMTQRERLRRDVQSLTAEGRVSAIVLGVLPVLLGFVMYGLNPDYISKLFNDTLGNILLGIAIVSMGIGFFWMKKIIDIEI